MAAKKYLRFVAGKIKDLAATIISAGAGNDGDIVALDATGKLDVSVMPVGIGAEVTVVATSESLVAGEFVNLWNDAGTIKARKADATTNAKPADGFTLANVTSPANATVYRISQTNNALTGLTIGSEYWLSTTPGGVTTTAPSGAGNISQLLGRAHATTALVFDSTLYVELT